MQVYEGSIWTLKSGIVYVWNSSSQEWEETGISFEPPHIKMQHALGDMRLDYLYDKKMGHGTLRVFKDSLNRYMGTYNDLY